MCGIMAAFNAPGAAKLVAAGLHHIQHRARDYAGMVSADGANLYRHVGPGLVREVFTAERLARLRGAHALGHIRYPTVRDEPDRDNIQPVMQGLAALAHNGNLTNAETLRTELERHLPLATSLDSECLLRLFQEGHGSSDIDRLSRITRKVRGTYAFVLLFPDRMIAFQDESGNRPLSVARRGDAWFVASETVALDAVQAYDDRREMEPGEVLIINERHVSASHLLDGHVAPSPCVFEEIYFSHPASTTFGGSVATFRMSLGRALAEAFVRRHTEPPLISGAVIVPVPDSANFIGVGVAQVLGKDALVPALMRSHDAGRTFIASDQVLRDWLVRQKFTLARELVAGKSVILVDDSIVRLTTLPPLVRLLREARAARVHVLIACPPVTHPCRYGINTPTREELAAANATPAELTATIGADTLTFLTLEELQAVSGTQRCFACLTGEYPIPE